jgi:acyl-coenzyme A synthetase/AMP-(fatty) acid ligase
MNIASFIDWATWKFGFTERDRISNHAPMHFDLSTLDIYSAISSGATLYPVPEELSLFPQKIVDFIKDNRLTVWHSAPFLLSYIAKFDALKEKNFPDLRYVFWAGEVFPSKYLNYWMRRLPEKRFFNLFGPTETTDISLYYEVREIPGENDPPVPIGMSCETEEVFAVKENGGRVSAGEEGELYIRSACVSPGYWNDQEKTAKFFVQNPLHGNFRDIVYKTGDLVRLRPDGNYEFLGRIDYQVKCRGYRIELGEIESAVYSHEGVGECAVVAIDGAEAGESELVAFVAPKSGAEITAPAMKEFLKNKLPHYMIPHYFEFIGEMPITGTGKIDRVKLKNIYAGR